MKQPLQIPLFGLTLSLIFTAFVVNADTAKTTTSQVTYHYYYEFNDLSEKKYYRFLPNPAPEALFYQTRMIASADIDATSGKETVVLIVVGSKPRAGFSNWHQAFLLITNTKARKLEKKAFFKLFDTGRHPLEVPAAKSIELHNRSVIFSEIHEAAHKPDSVSFRLVDLTGDGTLDIWVESDYGVALISFANGVFNEVLTNYTVSKQRLAEATNIEYYGYNVRFDPKGQKYHDFLAATAPEGLYYNTRKTAIGNIDDTPEKETIVLMTADTGVDAPQGEWVQAFLVIAEDEADGVSKKKELFKLFDAGTHAFDVQGKTIELQSVPFVFWKVRKDQPWFYYGVSFEVVDLTGDGILDIWVECAYGVAVISFQNGEFVEVCGGYSSPRSENPIEYVDLDKDGIYEIKIPDSIHIKGAPGAAAPEWMSLYEWDGTTYVLNNKRFYAENDEFLIRLLEQYIFWQPFSRNEEIYHFYIGLVYYYRGKTSMARELLQRVARNAENDDYRKAAEELLKKLTSY
ncbi:MAG: hypothetical protein OXH39_00410 [Candidatus Poribacteria bacterium]|nr:hypothetical protein [Candidatus Poribacteria bacterium]